MNRADIFTSYYYYYSTNEMQQELSKHNISGKSHASLLLFFVFWFVFEALTATSVGVVGVSNGLWIDASRRIYNNTLSNVVSYTTRTHSTSVGTHSTTRT